MLRGILAALGLINFGFGMLALIQPQTVAGWIGFGLLAPSAFGEMRAVFGGGVIVVGVFFVMVRTIIILLLAGSWETSLRVGTRPRGGDRGAGGLSVGQSARPHRTSPRFASRCLRGQDPLAS